MAHVIERLGLSDYEDCLRFLKMSFNEYDHRVDFDRELPKVFRPEQELMECNRVIREGKEIIALVGIYPMDLAVNGATLRCACIGNVATHPDHRGQGLMQELFSHCVAEADRLGIQMERLGGLRQRYNRFGFDCSGNGLRFDWTAYNSTMLQKRGDTRSHTFVPMSEETAEWLTKALALYHRNRCRVDRVDETVFLCVLKAHSHIPYAVLDESGAFAGYVIANDACDSIFELFAENPADAPAILASWCREKQVERIEIYCTCWDEEPKYIRCHAENCVSLSPSMFRIRDWEAVIAALFAYKNDLGVLPDGALRLAIEGYGTLLMQADSGKTSVKKTEGKGDITLDALTATRLIFGNLPPETAVNADRRVMGLLQQWFPLPLSWSRQDNV